jgi:hypothetical protein
MVADNAVPEVTLKKRVGGSSPPRPTNQNGHFGGDLECPFSRV